MSTQRLYIDFLNDIIKAIDDIFSFTQGMDEIAFTTDRRTLYAVIHALEIIGEATKRLPQAVQARHPQVPWRFMARMRDRVIHGYDTVDPAIVWQTITQDLLPTRTLLNDVLSHERSLQQP